MPTRPIIKASRRSKFEDKFELQLKSAGIPYTYEEHKFDYIVPARPAKYVPDFKIGVNIYIETKGNFNIRGKSADERKKLLMVVKNNPGLDLRLIFQDASKPIYRGAKVTHGMWAESNGFKWSDKGVLPQSWVNEAKKQIIISNRNQNETIDNQNP